MIDIQNHISLLFRLSNSSINYFVNKEQDETIRFVFCGIEKINKVSLAFLRLYPQIDNSKDLEFSLGILARSLLMDMILTMGVKKVFFKFDGSNLADIKAEVKQFCYKIITDGTSHFIDEIFSSNDLSLEEKEAKSAKFVSIFPQAFDVTSEKPKLKKEFRFKVKEIYEDSEDDKLVSRKAIYNLYSYYSKYDHLSHWTSLSSHFPFDKKRGKIDLSIVLMLMHLRDLLAIAYDYDENYKILLTNLDELQGYLMTNYDSKSMEEGMKEAE